MLIKAHLRRCLPRSLLDVQPTVRLRRASVACLAAGAFLSILCPRVLVAFELYSSEQFSLSLKGYYKNLYFTSKRQATNTWYHADLNRIRTEWDANLLKVFSAKVVWDNELIGGNYVGTEEFGRRQTQRAEPYLDLDYELVRKNNFFYGQALYRATGRLEVDPVTLTIGRQKVDWGVMRLFSPIDLFTRLPLFDIERDERVGATAANLTIRAGPKVRINPVWAFNPDFGRSRIGGRVTGTVGHFDLSVLGGKFLDDEVFGFDFTGDVKKAGVRGELIYDRAEFGKDFIQGAVGVDYGFENSFYFALEYFFNGQGTNNAATAAILPSGSQIQAVHQNFMALNMKYDLTPLWTASLQTIVDLNGGSLFLMPETRYAFFSWLEAAVGTQIAAGKGGGEFTAIPNVYYVQTQLFF